MAELPATDGKYQCWYLEFKTMHTDVVIILQIQLLQTSPPSKAVGYISEQLQSVIKTIIFVHVIVKT